MVEFDTGMTLSEVIVSMYGWADSNALAVLLVATAIPVVGTIAAFIGKGGRTDADGRLIASVVIGLGLSFAAFEVLAAWFAHAVLDQSLMQANVLLLVAPVVCLAGGLLGIRTVFPLNQLASMKSFADVGLFVAACGVALWLLSMFRGWGILFFGGIVELILLGVLGYLLLRRLYRRAFR